MGQYEAKALEKMKDRHQIVTIVDKKPFQDAVKPVWDKYAPQFSDMINASRRFSEAFRRQYCPAFCVRTWPDTR